MDLRADSISKKYMRNTGEANYFEPVKECSLFLKGGSLTLLSGRSGCGKTTLLSMLCGLLAPSTGSVCLDDKDLYSLDDKGLSKLRNRHFGIIPQGESALHSLTLLENVMLPAELFKDTSKKEAISQRADMLLEEFNISHLRDALPGKLSGGELRRMAICRALLLEPGLIFADEPTGDLDDDNTVMVFEYLRRLADEGRSVFLVSHENRAIDYADTVYRMDAGVITCHSEPFMSFRTNVRKPIT